MTAEQSPRLHFTPDADLELELLPGMACPLVRLALIRDLPMGAFGWEALSDGRWLLTVGWERAREVEATARRMWPFLRVTYASTYAPRLEWFASDRLPTPLRADETSEGARETPPPWGGAR